MDSKTGLNDNDNNKKDNDGLPNSSNYFWREESRWPLDVGRKYFRVSFSIQFVPYSIYFIYMYYNRFKILFLSQCYLKFRLQLIVYYIEIK